MTQFVVDASVAVKWFVPEIHSDAAKRILDPDHALIAPDLIWSELANAFWKKCRRSELPAAVARRMLADFERYPCTMVPTASLIHAAFNIADEIARPVYDCVYLALADRADCLLVTADRRFFDVIERSPFGKCIQWVEQVT